MTEKLGPADFRPFLAEITDCHCSEHCVPRAHLISMNSGQLIRYDSGAAELHQLLAANLLAALKAGTHRRVEMADFIAEAKRKAIEAGTYGQRGYTKATL